MSNWLKLFIPVLLLSQTAIADVIEFSEEELTSETVLPVFDNRRIVLNRNVTKTKKFEFGGGVGLALNEPFYNPLNFSLLAGYHFNELHGMNLQFNSFMDGLSSYGEQLKGGTGNPVVFFDASKAPSLKYMLMGNYQFDAYYGKISLTKKGVMNLSLFGTLGLGVLGFDSGTKFGLNFGLGQNFYITPSFAIRYDLRMVMYNGPDATSQALGPSDSPSASDFKDDLFFGSLLTLAGVVLL